ncbi:HIT domain-containing protein, partial [Candidatus Woesebacteria bacterium]|nr:HIT domain-containing protein [Candidatus Woesebacteria bacterium]
MADASSDDQSVFTKIINRELPAAIEYEDDEFIVIDNIAPVAPVHVLVIPKKPYRTLEDVEQTDTRFHARMLFVARTVAKKLGISSNYKLFMNVGTKVQAVQHVHLHVTGGWKSTAGKAELDAAGLKLVN